MRYSLIILLLTIGVFQTDKFGLKADLIKDRKRLAEEHGVHIEVKNRSQFEKYAAMDLSKFLVKRRVINNNSITKWTSKVNHKLQLFKIETVLAGDTVFRARELDRLTKRRSAEEQIIKLNPRDYVYYTYIVITEKGNRLIYLREKNEGLIEYRIDGTEFNALREVITLGQNYPDIDEIFKLTLALK